MSTIIRGRKKKPRKIPRVSITLRLPKSMAESVKKQARLGGLTVSDVVESALSRRPPRFQVSSAVVAQPLSAVGYRLVQALQAVATPTPDLDAVAKDLREARTIIASALRELHKQYDAELDGQGADSRDKRWTA